jgi:hypothetical protein
MRVIAKLTERTDEILTRNFSDRALTATTVFLCTYLALASAAYFASSAHTKNNQSPSAACAQLQLRGSLQ